MMRLHVQQVTARFGWPIIGILAVVVIAVIRIERPVDGGQHQDDRYEHC